MRGKRYSLVNKYLNDKCIFRKTCSSAAFSTSPCAFHNPIFMIISVILESEIKEAASLDYRLNLNILSLLEVISKMAVSSARNIFPKPLTATSEMYPPE